MKKALCIAALSVLLAACEETPCVARGEEAAELLNAVQSGTDGVAKTLLEQGADPNAKGDEGEPLLLIAIRRRNAAMVKLLVNAGADVNAPDADGYTPLDYALDRSSSYEICSILRKAGARFKCPHRDVIMTAAKAGDTSQLAELVEKGVSLEVRDMDNNTPLQAAIQEGQTEIVEFLLKHGADANQEVDASRSVPLLLARDAEMARILLEYGADINRRSGCQLETALHRAVIQDNWELVELLISRGADVNAKDSNGETPLHCAAGAARIAMFRLFLQKGADMDIEDFSQRTALHHAAASASAKMVRFLIDKSADPNARDKHGMTPLHTAASKSFIPYGEAKIRWSEKFGETVDTLINSGADVNALSEEGKTALDLAQMDEMKARLRRFGAVSGEELKRGKDE